MAVFPVKTGYLDVQGAPLYYEVAGEGPTILLLHAGIADHRMWDQQFAVFTQHYQTIRYDLRSFGRSQVPAGPFAHYEDPAALLQHLGVDRAHVVGASFGGKVAIDFALAYPALVASLILAAPALGGYPPSEEILRLGQEEDALLEHGDREAATELNLRMWVDGPLRTPEQVNPLVRQMIHDMQYHAFTIPEPENAELIALNPSAVERLAELHLATLIFAGDHDVPSMRDIAQKLSTHIAGAQYVLVPGAAHMVSMEQPELFTSTVLAFLDKQ